MGPAMSCGNSAIYDHQPWIVDRVYNAFDPLGSPAQAPVILKAQYHAALLGRGQTLLNAVDHPLESFILCMPLQDRLYASIGHELIERPAGTPPPSIEAHHRNAQLIGSSIW